MKGKGNDGAGNTIERDMWKTEQVFWNSLNKQYGFMFDCCATELDRKTEKYSSDFETVKTVKDMAWINPPFSKALDMFKHFFKVIKSGVGIYRFDNAETKIWQEVIFPNCTWVFVPKGRVSYTPFDIDMRNGGGTRFPSALIGVGVEKPKNITGITLYLTQQSLNKADGQ